MHLPVKVDQERVTFGPHMGSGGGMAYTLGVGVVSDNGGQGKQGNDLKQFTHKETPFAHSVFMRTQAGI